MNGKNGKITITIVPPMVGRCYAPPICRACGTTIVFPSDVEAIPRVAQDTGSELIIYDSYHALCAPDPAVEA